MRFKQIRAASKGASQSNDRTIEAAYAAAERLFGRDLPTEPLKIDLADVRSRLQAVQLLQFVVGINVRDNGVPEFDDLGILSKGEWFLVGFGPATALRMDAYKCVGAKFCRAQYEFVEGVWKPASTTPDAA